MKLYYNRTESLKDFRKWAKVNECVLRKVKAYVGGKQGYKIYDKDSNMAISGYITLADIKSIANYDRDYQRLLSEH